MNYEQENVLLFFSCPKSPVVFGIKVAAAGITIKTELSQAKAAYITACTLLLTARYNYNMRQGNDMNKKITDRVTAKAH